MRWRENFLMFVDGANDNVSQTLHVHNERTAFIDYILSIVVLDVSLVIR
jgi:hypothetical protein